MPRKRLPFASPTSITRWSADREHADCPLGLGGDAEHPRQVVAAPGRDDPQRDVAAGQRAADDADQAIAAHHHRDLAEVGGAQRLVDRVLGAAGLLDPEGDVALVELVLRPAGSSVLERPPPDGRVHQQQQRPIVELHRLKPMLRAVIQAGETFENPRTGTRLEFREWTPERVVFDRTYPPDTGRADPHVHFDLFQSWEVLSGEAQVVVDGETREVEGG